MDSNLEPKAPETVWRDDIATPVGGLRLAEILLAPGDAYSRPQWLAHHVSLSRDEKRVTLSLWLRDLLAESRGGAPLGAVAPVLSELDRLDAGAAAVFRRAFAAQGLVLAS